MENHIRASEMVLLNQNLQQDYEVESLLTTTTFGKVYKVRHLPSTTTRCLKMYVKNKMKTTIQNDFMSELDLLRGLDHPNTFKIFEYAQTENSFYLVSEFLAGGELFDHIVQAGTFNESSARAVILQVLYFVNYLHRHNIVHRDIKPENIMLSQPGSIKELKVIDFGTAKRLAPGTQLKEIVGTAYYMAPEIFSRSYDEKVDIWACGVILYILITGLPPFNANSDDAIHKKIVEEAVEFPHDVWKTVSPELIDLLKKMLDKDPRSRLNSEEVLRHPWF